jgi:hypothetical protein
MPWTFKLSFFAWPPFWQLFQKLGDFFQIIWTQWYKTHYICNFLMFIISWSVCPWKTFSTKSRPRAYPREDHLKGSPIGQAPALATSIILGWKGLPGENALAYYENLLHMAVNVL